MLFEKLTADEITIIEKMRHVADESVNSDFFSGKFVDTKTFLRFWEQEKAPMMAAFGDGLIVKKPVSITLEDDVLNDSMIRLTWSPEFEFVRDTVTDSFKEANEDVWLQDNLIETVTTRHYSLYEIFKYVLFSNAAWIDNIYDGPTCELKTPSGDTVKMIHGCKIMKLIGRLVKYCGTRTAQLFEELRLRQSQIMNEAHINANLCISIHPLDYMTASFNDNDWRSCMCWEDGEYRRGVIEMMNSPMVVVAYLEAKKQHLSWWNGMDNPRLMWNSKRWREFFIVRPDMISGIKGYPYWNRQLEDTALEMLREMFAPVFNTTYAPKIYPWSVESSVVDEKWDINCAPSMSCGPAMYNDFYSDNEYHAIFAVGADERVIHINYSGISECVCCGEEEDFDTEGDVVCLNCCKHYYCSHCGEIINTYDELYELDGVYYCSYCYNELDECSCCDRVIDVDNDEESFRFVVGYDDCDKETPSYSFTGDVMREYSATEDYDDMPALERKVCGACAREVFTLGIREVFNTHLRYNHRYFYLPVVPLNRLTEKGIKMLFDSKDVDYFRSIHAEEAISA